MVDDIRSVFDSLLKDSGACGEWDKVCARSAATYRQILYQVQLRYFTTSIL